MLSMSSVVRGEPLQGSFDIGAINPGCAPVGRDPGRSRPAPSGSRHRSSTIPFLLACLALCLSSNIALAQRAIFTRLPERQTTSVRQPNQLPRYTLPTALAPSTVSRPLADLTPEKMPLDAAIRLSMRNLDVIRVLAGVSASNSGRSIYDVALQHASIDQAQARFDPVLSVDNNWSLTENPSAVFDGVIPGNSLIVGSHTRSFQHSTRISKENLIGGDFVMGVDATPSHTSPGLFPLDPLVRTSTSVSYTQPLLRGGRYQANIAPIVIAGINTERSYFQFKDTMQEHVRGIIEAYWSLVAARTDVWARRQQVEQFAETARRIEARVRHEIDNRADLSQAQLAFANAKASVVVSEGNVLLREAALRNIIGIGPSDGTVYFPTTPPVNDRFVPDWDQMLLLAEERRPDLIELKLILEADRQQLIVDKNNALPSLDASALYRWNGLDGQTPGGWRRHTRPGEYTDWTIGVNFSVPLGLRQARASVRQQEMLIARDQINLKQGLHSTTHILAQTVRQLDQQYEQYLALREARQAARVNLDAQILRWRTDQTIIINVLGAITDWGNTVSSEANALTQYNTQLANLERQTGTILETHGIYFIEETRSSAGPHGHWGEQRCYPQMTRPTENSDQYEDSGEEAEKSFNLTAPSSLREKLPAVNYKDIRLQTLEESLEEAEREQKPE